MKDWRAKCVGQDKTLTIFKSTKGKTAVGYLDIAWKDEGGCVRDPYALLLSVDSLIKFTPTDQDKAAWFHSDIGPFFGDNSLGVCNKELMNSDNNCRCSTKGYHEYFNV